MDFLEHIFVCLFCAGFHEWGSYCIRIIDIHDHSVFVSLAGDDWKLSSLVGVDLACF